MGTGLKPPKSLLAANIVRLRKHKGWNQSDLAEAANLSVGAIKQIETDVSPGNSKTRAAIALALGCSPEDLIQKPPPTSYRQMVELIATLQRENDHLREKIAEYQSLSKAKK